MLKITVVDATNGAPLEGFTVVFEPLGQAFTDSSGTVEVSPTFSVLPFANVAGKQNVPLDVQDVTVKLAIE